MHGSLPVSYTHLVSNQLAHSDEVVQTDSLVEFYIHTFLVARDEQFFLELLADFFQLLQTFLQAFSRTSHAYIFPHDVAQFLVDRVYRLPVSYTHLYRTYRGKAFNRGYGQCCRSIQSAEGAPRNHARCESGGSDGS